MEDVQRWLSQNLLCLNEDKTEIIILGSRQMISRIVMEDVFIGNNRIKIAEKVRDLGFILDSSLTLVPQISKVCSSSFSALRTISAVIRSLSPSHCLLLIHALVVSRLLFCLSAYNGVASTQMIRLNRILSAAKRLYSRCVNLQSSSPCETQVPFDSGLLQLSVEKLITFRSASLIYSILTSGQPEYLRELFTVPQHRSGLRSTGSFDVPYRRTTMGCRAFSRYAPRLWNSLPLPLRLSDSAETFRSVLLETCRSGFSFNL